MFQSEEWARESWAWHRRVLVGAGAHRCPNYDLMPVDETCSEWPCGCKIEGGDVTRQEWERLRSDEEVKDKADALRRAMDAEAQRIRAARALGHDEEITQVGQASVGRVTVTDPVTGGQKDTKPAQIGALCPRAMLELGKVAGFGAAKYARFNFLRGYAWSLSVDALLRHLMAFLDGEDRDPESGCHHAAHIAWHGLTLTAFALRRIGTDDRAHLAVPQSFAAAKSAGERR